VSNLDEIVTLQKRLKKLGKKCDDVDYEIEDVTAEYGYREDIEARLREINDSLSEIIHIVAEEHGEFDSRHSVTYDGQITRFRAVPDCPDCDSIIEAHGLADVIEENKNLQWAQKRLKKLEDRRDDMGDDYEDLRAQINELGQAVGLPSFEVRWDDDHGLVGLITQVGPIKRFKLHEKVILEDGRFANYDLDGRSARAIFDTSEQLVAYHLGDRQWVELGSTQYTQDKSADVHVKVHADWSGDRQAPKTDLYIFDRHSKTSEHEHIAIDDSGNVIHDTTDNFE
jgi:hypothetical protein